MTYSKLRCFFSLALLAAAGGAVSGCLPLVFGAGAGTAAVAGQERSLSDTVNDNKIFLEIKALFARSENNGIFANVAVKVSQAKVLLTGNVDKPEQQIEAVRLAWTVANVKEVHNEMTVNDTSSFWNYTRDVWISTQIRTRLLATRGIRSINYSVVTVNQVVYLVGIAQDRMELDNVTRIASVTPYVQRVVSYVTLKGSN